MTTSPVWKHRIFILFRIGCKAVYKVLASFNKKLQPKQFYCIKPGYHHASKAETFVAIHETDQFQRSVYELANSLAESHRLNTVLDVGCGSAYKLIAILGKYSTTGIETEPAYTWLLKKYPDRNWLLFDPVKMPQLNADLVICSDVIEHIKDPNEMMEFLSRINFNILLLSTPERDRVSGKRDYGPPENTSHFREWNSIEFYTYVSHWFAVQEQFVFDDRSITQVLVCRKLSS
jgi:SAM-dependent methyltransferase